MGKALGGITGGLFGGSSSSGGSTSGFGMLPPEIQKAFSQYGTQLADLFKGTSGQNMFTPLGQTDFETQALDSVRQGLAPTEQSLRSDISMLMNPFDDYVISDINRQAQGEGSILNQALNSAGQLGSNRAMLGASDIDTQRLNQIGQFRQNQYNNAVNQALGRVSDLRQSDIGNQFGAGSFLRGLDLQQKQVPFSTLQGYGGLLGALPQNGGSVSNQSSSSNSGGLGTAIGAGLSFFSDKTLKENIKPAGTAIGAGDKIFNIYEFNYIGDDVKYQGVIAQEVEEIYPEAVTEVDGYKAVNYDMIGIEFKEV